MVVDSALARIDAPNPLTTPSVKDVKIMYRSDWKRLWN
jgi:hypothetical protein